jgi:predicted RNA-binding protein associated with RNAse of E/G family
LVQQANFLKRFGLLGLPWKKRFPRRLPISQRFIKGKKFAKREVDGLKMPEAITVIKQDIQGHETFRYSGLVLERSPEYVRLEARFNRDEVLVQDIILRRNDRFVETFYTRRWYNIFEIYDRQDDLLKAWYCNVGYPAELEAGIVSYRDLALDLLVYPDGRQVILDEEEFTELDIRPEVRRRALSALGELQEYFRHLSNKPDH